MKEAGLNKYGQKKSIAVYLLFAALLILFTAVVGAFLLFRVTDIIVEGRSRYGSSEIIKASGLSRGDSLSLSDKGAAARRIREKLPYINEVRIITQMPGTIILRINESKEIAFISAGTSGIIIDKDCRVLEITSPDDSRGLITVTGFDVSESPAGKPIPAEPGRETALLYLKDILSALSDKEIDSETDLLDISNISNITFRYLDRFSVELGSGADAAQKISTLLTYIPQAEPGSSYVVRVKDPSMTTLIKLG